MPTLALYKRCKTLRSLRLICGLFRQPLPSSSNSNLKHLCSAPLHLGPEFPGVHSVNSTPALGIFQTANTVISCYYTIALFFLTYFCFYISRFTLQQETNRHQCLLVMFTPIIKHSFLFFMTLVLFLCLKRNVR